MAFSVLFWNVLYTNQTGDADKLSRLLEELKRLCEQHEPDFVVLNEVVQPSQDELPPVVEYLKTLGYRHHHCTHMDHIGKYWMSGVAIISKSALHDRQRHIISKNGSAARYGYPGLDKEIISASAALPGGSNINIIAAHPTAMIDSVKQHLIGKRSLDKLIRSGPFTRNTLLLGDMNEWRYMPGSLRSRTKDIMHAKTGSFRQPTWRLSGSRFAPLRLNLDYIYWSRQSDFRLKDFRVLRSDASDHKPLLAVFG